MRKTLTSLSRTSPLPPTPACFLTLQKAWTSLPEHHERMARFAVLNTADFLELDARKIGYHCRTSEATVVRFCQRVGYKGLSEMKRVLARELAANLLPTRTENKPTEQRAIFDQLVPFNPLGVKGVGEAGTNGAPPAVANALMDALAPLGIEHVDMPYTAPKLWELIRQAEKRIRGES